MLLRCLVSELGKTTCNSSITGLVEEPRGICLFFVKVTRGCFIYIYFGPSSLATSPLHELDLQKIGSFDPIFMIDSACCVFLSS